MKEILLCYSYINHVNLFIVPLINIMCIIINYCKPMEDLYFIRYWMQYNIVLKKSLKCLLLFFFFFLFLFLQI